MTEPYDWIRRLDLKAIGAQLRPGPKPRPACNTEAGYQAHRYRHEKPCGPCKVAHCRHNQQRAAS